MTVRYFPFDSGSGANVTELQWRDMMRHILASGVLRGEDNELEVYGDSSGMQVKVRTGKFWIRGHYYDSDAEQTVAISASDPANPRIDRVVIQADFTANTIAVAVLEGTPAGAPSAPSVTQSSALWEISLAQVAVAAAAATIDAGDVTDERTYSGILTAGLPGATLASRYVGATATAAPVAGTFAVGDYVIARNGLIFVCTAAGTPGTWADITAAHAALTAAHGATGAVVGTTNIQTLTNKTLTQPTIGDFTNAGHDHGDADDGGTLGLGTASGGSSGAVASGATTVVYDGGAGDGAVHAFLLTTKKTVGGVDVQTHFGLVYQGTNGYLEWRQLDGGGGSATTISVVSNTQLQIADSGGGITTAWSLVKLF